MLSYETAAQNIFAKGTVPDGYSDRTKAVRFALIDNKVIVVANCGCFNAGLPNAADTHEALWLLQSHPSSVAYDVRPI